MKIKWLHTGTNSKLILFFNGWGMDENIIAHLRFDGFDLCMFYDYSSLDINLKRYIEGYTELYVIAWSMGVWVAHQCCSESNLKINRSIAINATPYPIHNDWGIPKKVYDITLRGFNETNRDLFFTRMCANKECYKKFNDIKPIRTLENQREELANIKNIFDPKKVNDFTWNCAIIGVNDLIFPYKNLMKYWSIQNCKIVSLANYGHFPFFHWTSWKKLLCFDPVPKNV